MNDQLPRDYLLSEASILQQTLGQLGQLGADDIQGDVEVKIGPSNETAELGDTPTPALVS